MQDTVVRLVVEESSRGSKLAVYTLNCRQLAVTQNTLARCDVESCVLDEFVQRCRGILDDVFLEATQLEKWC